MWLTPRVCPKRSASKNNKNFSSESNTVNLSFRIWKQRAEPWACWATRTKWRRLRRHSAMPYLNATDWMVGHENWCDYYLLLSIFEYGQWIRLTRGDFVTENKLLRLAIDGKSFCSFQASELRGVDADTSGGIFSSSELTSQNCWGLRVVFLSYDRSDQIQLIVLVFR